MLTDTFVTVRVAVFTEVTTKSVIIFGDVTSRELVEIYRCFGKTVSFFNTE
jgi:hypothetical protein